MQPKREFDADEAAQDVVNACAMALQGGSLPADIDELFYKMPSATLGGLGNVTDCRCLSVLHESAKNI